MSERLAGKVALITGSTSGIGRATAQLFAQHGAKVVVNGRRKELGDQVVEGIRAAGGEAAFFHGDLTESQVVRDAVRFTITTYGRLDVLMNNAYFPTLGAILDVAEADWDRSMAILLKAPFIACQEAIPQMIKQGGGSIINTSSVHGFLGSNRANVYDTAKAGLINITKQIALEYGPNGIRSNAVCPGAVIVERSQHRFVEDPDRERRASIVYPIRRIGRPIDIAYAALYLASDEASFVTGTTLMVDGGLTCQLADSLPPFFEQYWRETLAKEWGITKDAQT